ncbi:MAG: fibronectin type III domain-containing protein, partial [Chloroflexi bacterium]|nr:fibronectin type III domain-containing protein [Chloroflexota bacterium]
DGRTGDSLATALADDDPLTFLSSAPAVVPAAPTLVSVTFSAPGSSSLVWSLNSANNDDLIVFRRDVDPDSGAGEFSERAVLASGDVDYLDSGLSNDEQFEYKVAARNGAGDGLSGALSILTLPNALEVISATALSNSQIRVDFEQRNANPVTHEVWYREAGGTFAFLATVLEGVLTYTATGLDPAKLYEFQVRPENETGYGGFSDTVSAETLADASTPAAPSSPFATYVSDTRIDTGCIDEAGDETGFEVWRSVDGGAFTLLATKPTNTPTHSDTTVTEDHEYAYKWRAINAVGPSNFTDVAIEVTRPVGPTSLSASALSNSAIHLVIGGSSPVDDGFKVEAKTGTGAYSEIDVVVDSDGLGYTATALSVATPYTFRVRRYNENGDSAYSPEASATTFSTGPDYTPLSGHLEGGYEVGSGEFVRIEGEVTLNGNLVNHGNILMRPEFASAIRFVGIDNALWSFDSPAQGIDASDWGLWNHGNAVLDALGTPKTHMRYAAGSIAKNATLLTLAVAPVGWQVGDDIAISPTRANDWQGSEVRTITGTSGTTVEFAGQPLAFDHPSVNVLGTTFTAEVVNLSRDVKIYGTGPGQNTHVMFMDHVSGSSGVSRSTRCSRNTGGIKTTPICRATRIIVTLPPRTIPSGMSVSRVIWCSRPGTAVSTRGRSRSAGDRATSFATPWRLVPTRIRRGQGTTGRVAPMTPPTSGPSRTISRITNVAVARGFGRTAGGTTTSFG